ncbi:MAG: SPOR domain-containing protein [Parvibaculaceae bacterium]
MDQDTSNSPGKARWRERLGMGSPGKEMPKISDEFKATPQASRPAPAASPPKEVRSSQAALRSPQPVTKPAPMAPRTPPRAAPQGNAAPRPVSPIPQGASGLGDRLRAERSAAEKLAEQRIAQARSSGPERPLQPPANQRSAPAPERAPEKPKFSFSAEELAKDKREQTIPAEREFPTFSSKPGLTTTPPPPLTPPRPALGGNAQSPPPRQQPSQAQPPKPQAQPPKPQANAGPAAGPTSFQPRFNTAPQPPVGNYRSLDPPPGGFAPKAKPYADTAAFRDDPLARRPTIREYDAYRRGPALPPSPQPAFGEEGPSLDYRRRAPVPARARRPAYDEEVNEVFEDEEPPRPQRRRASAQDYNRDYEDGYDAETPRRRGPWLWLLAIAAIGLLAAGVIYYYLTYMKGAGQANGNVPVIEAPQQAPKTEPEPGSGSTLGTQGSTQPNAADQRKQIYDRILGDDEVGGNQVVPTQEQPQTVEPTGDNGDQGAVPLPSPASGTDDNAGEPMPLPLPPPGEQGALPNSANQQEAAMGAVNKSAPVQAISNTVADTGAPVPGQLRKSTEQSAAQPPPEQVSEPEPLPVQPEKPAKAKLKAEKKPPKKVAAVEEPGAGQNDSAQPLVLVPPAQTGTTQAQNMQDTPTPVAVPDVTQQTAAADQKSKSFFGFGSTKRKLTGKAAERASAQGAAGNWANSPDPSSVAAETAGSEPQQIASVAPEPLPMPAPAPEPAQPAPQQAKASTGGGYIAQLSSFRSEAEAMAEYDRLRSKHGGVLAGLSPRVVKANVAGGSRYRLGVGPLASRSAASKLCNSLIAAGERDCLVRGN